MREFFLANARYWVEEFHIDGLRLDAVHAIVDDSPDTIVTAIARTVREAAGDRGTLVIAENELQDARLLRPLKQGGGGLDAAWNDDFHHSARVAMTGRSEYYYGDYRGTPQELISALKWGYLYQGQWNAGKASPAARRRLTSPRRDSSRSCKITIRWATRLMAGECMNRHRRGGTGR